MLSDDFLIKANKNADNQYDQNYPVIMKWSEWDFITSSEMFYKRSLCLFLDLPVFFSEEKGKLISVSWFNSGN